MVSKKKKKCPLCNGKGYYIEESEDIYRARKILAAEEAGHLKGLIIKILRKEYKKEFLPKIYTNFLKKLDKAMVKYIRKEK